MVMQLFHDVEQLRREILRLKGRMDSISVGNKIIPGSISGGVQMPLPIEGAMLYGNGIPEWARLPPPSPGDDYTLRFIDGATAPSWEVGGGVSGLFYIPFGSGEEVFSP